MSQSDLKRNSKKLAGLAAAAPFVTAFLTTLGGGIDILMVNGMPLKSSGIVLADIAIGYWQGKLLARHILKQGESASGFYDNLSAVVRRGALSGILTGLVNGLIMTPPSGWFTTDSAFFNTNFPLMSAWAGVMLGLAAGFPIGFIFAAYIKHLRLEATPAGTAR